MLVLIPVLHAVVSATLLAMEVIEACKSLFASWDLTGRRSAILVLTFFFLSRLKLLLALALAAVDVCVPHVVSRLSTALLSLQFDRRITHRTDDNIVVVRGVRFVLCALVIIWPLMTVAKDLRAPITLVRKKVPLVA